MQKIHCYKLADVQQVRAFLDYNQLSQKFAGNIYLQTIGYTAKNRICVKGIIIAYDLYGNPHPRKLKQKFISIVLKYGDEVSCLPRDLREEIPQKENWYFGGNEEKIDKKTGETYIEYTRRYLNSGKVAERWDNKLTQTAIYAGEPALL